MSRTVGKAAPGKRVIRPLGVVGIVGVVIDVYKSNFPLLVGTGAVCSVPMGVYSATGGRVSFFTPLYWVSVAAYCIIHAVQVLAVAQSFLGPVSLMGCIKRIFRRTVLVAVVTARLLQEAVLSLPFAVVSLRHSPLIQRVPNGIVGPVFFLAACWILYGVLRFLVFTPAIVLEGKSAIDSLRRSWQLTRGNVFKTFKVLALMMLPYLAESFARLIIQRAAGPHHAVLPYLAGNVLLSAVTVLLQPVTVIAATVIYFDIRCRKEGFDIEILAKDVNSGALESPAGDEREGSHK